MTAPGAGAVLGVEVAEGLRGVIREPAALFFSVVVPVLFFTMFTALFGSMPSPNGLPVAASMLATFGAFGVVSVMQLNPGISVASDRESGWLRMKKVSAAPVWITIAGKVLAALPYALAVLAALTAVALAVVGPVIGVGPWLRLVVVLLLGSLPFACLGLAVGFLASANATTAILNAILFPMVIASGLWIPLEAMPAWVGGIAPFLPTYHLAQLALAQLTGAPAAAHVLVLLAATVVTGGLAGWAYRNLRV
ncbi:ABC-2 type transport system permease protein [Pseudonocardia thermophila]|jgi:ABC-type multidrug transport system, permease component|uniref:Transport permease protein n=1 Tax=Pseudonocardia thermophila TaxID=1848 RepID=A0A1M6VZF4_PSETH|nr:ABC transporter permease [Pseudonocardia thermophila]SHK86819.1 ABC-2 type transport system permease protein [Pseudonocardia thermophila]